MPIVQLAAIAACVILAALAIFQAALIAGAPLGRFAWGSQHSVLPTKLRISKPERLVMTPTVVVLTALYLILSLNLANGPLFRFAVKHFRTTDLSSTKHGVPSVAYDRNGLRPFLR